MKRYFKTLTLKLTKKILQRKNKIHARARIASGKSNNDNCGGCGGCD